MKTEAESVGTDCVQVKKAVFYGMNHDVHQASDRFIPLKFSL